MASHAPTYKNDVHILLTYVCTYKLYMRLTCTDLSFVFPCGPQKLDAMNISEQQKQLIKLLRAQLTRS
jgi:hypothetical protein